MRKQKKNNMRSTIHAWVIFFLYLRQGGFGLVICVWQSFILPPHQPPPNFQPLRSKPSPPDLERPISDFIQFVTWNRPESLTECYWPWQANSFMPSGTVDRCDLFFAVVCVAIACEQQTHFRSSLLSLRKKWDDRKCVCCSQASVASVSAGVRRVPL